MGNRLRKRLKVGIKIGIIIVLLLILEATVTQEWSINDVARLIQRGAQEASLSLAGENSFFFQVSPPWGKALVDGKPVEHLPQVTTDTPLNLAAGEHTL